MRILMPIFLAACSIPNMPVASTLAPQQPFSQSIMSRGDVRFGTYRVTHWSEESGSDHWRGNLLPDMLRHGEGYEDYGFDVEEDGQPQRAVRCSAAMQSESLKAGRTTITSSTQSLRCVIWLAPGGADYASLELGDDAKGSLTYGGRTYPIEGRNILGRPDTLDPAGHAILNGTNDVVVAQRANGGAVWIARDVAGPERGLYAAAAAALLVYRPLSTH
jgi:hypothetical protein